MNYFLRLSALVGIFTISCNTNCMLNLLRTQNGVLKQQQRNFCSQDIRKLARTVNSLKIETNKLKAKTLKHEEEIRAIKAFMNEQNNWIDPTDNVHRFCDCDLTYYGHKTD